MLLLDFRMPNAKSFDTALVWKIVAALAPETESRCCRVGCARCGNDHCEDRDYHLIHTVLLLCAHAKVIGSARNRVPHTMDS